MEKTYTVKASFYAFETYEEAEKYMNLAMDIFCEMPESKELGSTWGVKEETYDE